MAARKPKTPSLPTQKAEKKKIDILKAAGKCFRRTGFHQTSMQEICAEIGLGPGAVYRYFSSKESIIEAMAEHERRQARAVLLELRQADHLPKALAGAARAFAQRYASGSDTSLMAEVFAEGLRNKRVGAAIRKIEDEWIAGLAELLHAAQSSGHVHPSVNAHDTALLLTTMWDGMVIRRAYSADSDAHALPDMVASTVACLLSGVVKVERPPKREKPAPARTTVKAPPAKSGKQEKMPEIDIRQMSLI